MREILKVLFWGTTLHGEMWGFTVGHLSPKGMRKVRDCSCRMGIDRLIEEE